MGQSNQKPPKPKVLMTRDYDYAVHPATQWRWHKQHLAEEAFHTEEDVSGSYANVWEKFKSNFDFDLFNPANPIARTVVSRARWMAESVVAHETEDVLHRDWELPSGEDVLAALFEKEDMDELAEDVLTLIEEAQTIFQSDPNLNKSDLPAKVYGDMHGQFRDMLLLLHDFGYPHGYGQSFIFNGDWVDRGLHQLEVVCLVFAYKVAYPHNVKLNRGNHEDSVMNTGSTGFRAQCEIKFGERGEEIFQAFSEAFQWLPLGTVVVDRILIVHGGIGDGKWDLSDLDRVQRPLNNDQLYANSVVYNLLWSDPVPETKMDSFGVHDSPRDNHQKKIHCFGNDVTSEFLKRNKLQMLIRSHEARSKGCGYEVMHGGKCVRVFSARDYEHHDNDACVLSIRRRNPYGEQVLVRPQVLRSLTHAEREFRKLKESDCFNCGSNKHRMDESDSEGTSEYEGADSHLTPR